ncbi:MAG TPA: tripartite tricarboxylate transporter substrate binding protein [Xanthobacteraceae bacterium]
MNRTFIQTAGLVFALSSVCAPVTRAADWPVRPVRIVAPSTPGGAADLFGRLMADHLGEILKQRFYVDNRAGGGGLIGAQITARAEPDGYTFVTSSVAYHAIEPAASPNPGFDPMRDFTHIAFIGGPPTVFIVNPSLGVRSLAALVARAREKPLDFVSPGVGTLGHLMVEEFAQQAGIRLQHIPHKGSAQAMLDIIAGNVLFGAMTWSSALPQIRAGNVIPIAVSSKARVPEFPDVPTLAELGYPRLVATTWYALSGPAGVPDEIVRKLNHAVSEVLALPDVKERFRQDAIEGEPMTPEEVTKFVGEEVARWGPIAKKFVRSP